ncbi:hypothetical protein POV27_14085 [Aureisphaera galaxeae]|uniref:hypothetical protein n=1 Tax=Aureisphaera galaxeae TaxID=1538023 RepID=UPI0023506CB3|nr:hypothetical protein [Aureisphaera galaxeae]MDC8005187.1 hypothetical protein [Aureisphaera galaxeae]
MMRKQTIITALLSLFLIIGISNTAEAQFGKKAKQALGLGKKGKKKKKGKGGGSAKFSDFNNEADEMGVTGQYFELKDGKAYGFRFVKEADGKMVNQLHYFESKGDPALKMAMKESYYNKYQVKLFFEWMSASSSGYIELIEVDPGVLAQIKSDRSLNRYEDPVPLDAERTVINVYAKDKAAFDTWDIETAQAKVDMVVGTLKGAQGEKIKKKLMRFEVYKNYKGKIAFAKGTNYLRNQKDNQPIEKPENFITKRELGSTVAFKPYFEQPLEQSHPGAWFNITYEMAGVKTDREALRKSSSTFAKNIPQIDKDKDKFYFWYPKVTINTSNNVADYAFLELLRLAQDKLQAGQTYDLKVTVWAHKDGENLDPVAQGTIQLEYTAEANGTQKLLFDPVDGWVTKIEDVLDE